MDEGLIEVQVDSLVLRVLFVQLYLPRWLTHLHAPPNFERLQGLVVMLSTQRHQIACVPCFKRTCNATQVVVPCVVLPNHRGKGALRVIDLTPVDVG